MRLRRAGPDTGPASGVTDRSCTCYRRSTAARLHDFGFGHSGAPGRTRTGRGELRRLVRVLRASGADGAPGEIRTRWNGLRRPASIQFDLRCRVEPGAGVEPAGSALRGRRSATGASRASGVEAGSCTRVGVGCSHVPRCSATSTWSAWSESHRLLPAYQTGARLPGSTRKEAHPGGFEPTLSRLKDREPHQKSTGARRAGAPANGWSVGTRTRSSPVTAEHADPSNPTSEMDRARGLGMVRVVRIELTISCVRGRRAGRYATPVERLHHRRW